MKISRRSLLALSATAVAKTRRPNIIVFMTDDHGAWASSVYGCAEMHTPNLQRLADTGTKFSRAYATTPVCSPSRMTYLTGTLPSKHHVQDYLMPEDSSGTTARRWVEGLVSYSSLLAKSGYHCGLTGKWHLGRDAEAQEGFRYWATVPGGGGTFRDAEFVRNGERIRKPGFKEDAIGDFALEFLAQPRQEPFFLLVPFYAPHTPYDYQPDADRAPYAKSDFGCFPRLPAHPWANRGLRRHMNDRASMESYSALVTGMDRNVGRIVDYLDRAGLRDNATIIFTADQGYNTGHHGFWGKGNGTWPFNLYEESVRVPLIWNHPGRIAAGQTLDPMLSAYDFFPTLLDWAGVKPPPAVPERVGRSYAGFLRGRAPTRWPDRVFFEYAMVRGVRTANLKLVMRTSEWPSEFFDLESDPGETRNLWDSPAHTSQRDGLIRQVEAFFTKSGAGPHADWKKSVTQRLNVYER
ncbi:MAG: sulfatase-like hydrolase/transferase [Bryobacteraceae bacterium]|nr:sulfatase-like hydrolase/transferase [Bryobacteraceae bacterium]